MIFYTIQNLEKFDQVVFQNIIVLVYF